MTEPLICVYPSELGGSAFYRLREPTRVLQAAGRPIVEDIPLHGEFEDTPVKVPIYKGEGRNRELYGWEHKTETRLLQMLRPPVDVVVFQRPILDERVQMIPLLQELGVAVVVELDDDFRHIQGGNVAWKVLHPTLGKDPRRSWRNVNRAAAMADVLTVSTPSLKDVYDEIRHGKPTVVLPNFVPAAYLEIGAQTLLRPERVQPLIGWSGSVATHPWDLEQTRGAVAEALRRHPDWRFHGIGTGVGLKRRLHLEEEPEHTEGWVPLEEYPYRMAELDLGIVPLEDNTFNRGKSYLKGLEWASLGVPFVASPLAEYRLLASMGAGWLARRSRDWRRQLSTLMSNSEARAALARSGYVAARRMTYEEHAEMWWHVWSTAVNVRRAAA